MVDLLKIKRFVKNTSGGALIEFALVLMVSTVIYIGSSELFNLMNFKRNLDVLTIKGADIISAADLSDRRRFASTYYLVVSEALGISTIDRPFNWFLVFIRKDGNDDVKLSEVYVNGLFSEIDVFLENHSNVVDVVDFNSFDNDLYVLSRIEYSYLISKPLSFAPNLKEIPMEKYIVTRLVGEGGIGLPMGIDLENFN